MLLFLDEKSAIKVEEKDLKKEFLLLETTFLKSG